MCERCKIFEGALRELVISIGKEVRQRPPLPAKPYAFTTPRLEAADLRARAALSEKLPTGTTPEEEPITDTQRLEYLFANAYCGPNDEAMNQSYFVGIVIGGKVEFDNVRPFIDTLIRSENAGKSTGEAIAGSADPQRAAASQGPERAPCTCKMPIGFGRSFKGFGWPDPNCPFHTKLAPAPSTKEEKQ